ncbi:hypothetical protein ABIC28_004591 [Rhodococcus sp. PvR044]|uniref:hypothetical protein n=1 Tax=Rhodococcus sp. PvR044 TaxID=3156402 RepID=UPI00339ABD90
MKIQPIVNLALLAGALAVPSPASASASEPPPLAFVNPGFEQDMTGWTFTGGTGNGTNLKHSGAKNAYLDEGTGFRISQTVTVPADGMFDLSAWIATGAPEGTFSATVNGVPAASVTFATQQIFARYTLSRLSLRAGDRVEIAFGSSPNGWVNIDDITVAPSAPNDPRIDSSDARLTEMFNWAKAKANSWVQQPGQIGAINADENNSFGTSAAPYANTYWAGYPYRSGFYSRDFVHQLAGAHLLGLDAANKTMLKAFAASATAANKYDPVWSINFDAKTYLSADYRDPGSYVRELPAPFELAQKLYEAYRQTGDTDYLTDPTLSDYAGNTVTEFVEQHPGPRGHGDVKIAQATSSDIFAGTASYNEGGWDHFAEAGDSIGSQYQAYLAAAGLASAKGDTAGAQIFTDAAQALKNYYNTTWSIDPAKPGEVVRAYQTYGGPITGWGKENSWFMPLKGIMEPGQRRDSYLSFIDSQASGSGAPANVEAETYLPETFFANSADATAWKWMQNVYNKIGDVHSTGKLVNGDYPEVAFTLVSQTVNGLLGVRPDAPNSAVTTTSHLPADIGWLEVASIPLGKSTFTLRHDALTKSALTNTGATPLSWTAQFPGAHSALTVNGATQKAETEVVDGSTVSYATVTVAPDATTTVEVSA